MDLPIPPPPPPPPPPLQPDSNLLIAVEQTQRRANHELNLSHSSELIDAIKEQDLSLVQTLIENGEDVNQLTICGTPLSVAVRANNLQLIQLLLAQRKCNVNTRDYDGETAFCLSLRKRCSTDISLYLLSQGSTINCVDSVTRTSLLATAVDQQLLDIIKAMISQGCDVDIRDGCNLTPLAHACLLPEPEDGDDDSQNTLHIKEQLIVTLYKAGANVNIRLGPPFNGYLLHKLVLEKAIFAMSVLLSLEKEQLASSTARLDINIVNAIEKNTPLHFAVAIGDARIVKLLLDHGAETNVANVFCDSPLSKALKDKLYDQTDIIKVLLESGADPNYECKLSNSRRKGPCHPLFAAIENGDRDVVDTLLSHGADLSALDYQGFCPIMPCLANGLSISLLHYIVDMMDSLHIAYDISSWDYLRTSFSWTRHLQYLIDRGLNINARSSEGHMIIHTVAVKFYPASLEVLLLNGLDPNSLSGDGNTTLSACAGLAKYWEAIQLLVQYGADINRQFVSDFEEERLIPLQKAFRDEYDDDIDPTTQVSQFRYFVNCGAIFTSAISKWGSAFIADRMEAEISEADLVSDDSDLSSDLSSTNTDHRKQLLCDMGQLSTPLTLAMLCRRVIRSTILSNSSTRHVKVIINSLPLPGGTKDFLAFINVPTGFVIR